MSENVKHAKKRDEVVSLPELPPEWKTCTGDPEIDRVANLPHIALATILDARRNKYSLCQIAQLQKLFEKECIEAKGFFGGTGRKTIELPPSERIDFVKSETAWVDTVSEWFRQNWSGPINLNDWKGLHDQLISLIEVHDVMWSISIETIKQKAKLVLKEVLRQPAETEQTNAKSTFLVSFLGILAFILWVHLLPITWIKDHPHGLGLQGSIIFLIPCLVVGYFKPKYRKWCWGGAALSLVVLILSLI